MRIFSEKSQAAQHDTSTMAGRPILSPSRPTDGILHLQRTVGNQAVQRLLTGAQGSRSEQEADRAAELATRRSEPIVGSDGQRGDQTLSRQEKTFFGSRFGHDFSQVRIHADARSAEMAEALNAEAFTFGRDIYFGAGKRGLRTRETDRLLAHELAHVVDQARTGPALQAKLKMTGTPGYVSRAITLLSAGLGGFYYVSVDKSGEVKIEPVAAAHRSSATGPDPQQKALAERLTTVINDPKDVIMTVSSGSRTLVGSYVTGDVDIADIEQIGVNALIHEIEEQYQKQVKGLAMGSETSGAHGEGIKAESEVKGATRGPQKIISSTVNADGTLDLVVEIPYTYPNGTVKTMVMTVTRNNVGSVTWK